MARKKKQPEPVSHERWLVSYADFITLLFAFFTTLYAISTVDAKKMGKMVMSMQSSFDSTTFPTGSDHLTLFPGVGGADNPVEEMVQRVRSPREAGLRDFSIVTLEDLKTDIGKKIDGSAGDRLLGNLMRIVESAVHTDQLEGQVHVRREKRGVVLSLGEGGFFDSGSEKLKPQGQALLDTLTTSLTAVTNHIRIEGHTDNVPIKSSRFPSNWELSTARATTIVAYMVEKFGFDPDRLSASGYAEFRPVASNDTREGRARNRRVDIVILNARYAMVEPR